MNEMEIRNADPIRSIIMQQYDRMLSDGTIENMVKEALNRQIDSVIKDSFGSYRGQAHDLISKKLEEIIIPALDASNFSRMTEKLSVAINEALEQSNLSEYESTLRGLQQMVGVPAIKFGQGVSLSEIFREYVNYILIAAPQYLDSDAAYDDGEGDKTWTATCSMEAKRDGSIPAMTKYWIVDLACEIVEDGAIREDDAKKLNFSFRLRESYDGRIFLLLDDPLNMYDIRSLNGFLLYLRQIKAKWCPIDIDDTSMSDDVEIDCNE